MPWQKLQGDCFDEKRGIFQKTALRDTSIVIAYIGVINIDISIWPALS